MQYYAETIICNTQVSTGGKVAALMNLTSIKSTLANVLLRVLMVSLLILCGFNGLFCLSITGRLTETSYSYKLVCCDGQLGSLVEKSTGIRLLGKKKDSNADADDTALEFVIIFTPPKAFEYVN